MDLASMLNADAQRICSNALSTIATIVERATLTGDASAYPHLSKHKSAEVDRESQGRASWLIALPGFLCIVLGAGMLRPQGTKAQAITLCAGLCVLALSTFTRHTMYVCAPTNDFPKLLVQRIRHEADAAGSDALVELTLLEGAITDFNKTEAEYIASLAQCTARPRFPLPTFRDLVAAWRTTPNLLPERLARIRAS